MTELVRVFIVDDEEGEPCWMTKQPDGDTSDVDNCIVDVPVEIWDQFDAARKSLFGAIGDALEYAGRDRETGDLPVCDKYDGDEYPTPGYTRAVITINGKEYSFARSPGLDGDRARIEAHVELLRNAVAEQALCIVGFGPDGIIRLEPGRDVVTVTEVPPSTSRPYSCRRCGNHEYEHVDPASTDD